MSAVGSAAEVSAQGGFGDWINGVGGALHSISDIVGSGLGIVNDFKSLSSGGDPRNPATHLTQGPPMSLAGPAPAQPNWLLLGGVALLAYFIVKKL
jgi:hypothetical protein